MIKKPDQGKSYSDILKEHQGKSGLGITQKKKSSKCL